MNPLAESITGFAFPPFSGCSAFRQVQTSGKLHTLTDRRLTSTMNSPSSQERSAWKQWNEKSQPLIDALTRSTKHDLHHNDRFAWHLQQFGRLDRDEIDQVERTHLASELYEIATDQLNDLRSRTREVMKTLLLIWLAPAADKTTLVEWRHQLADHREAIAVSLTNNPSLRPFLPAIIEIAWKTARGSAARALDNCNFVHREIRSLVLRKQRTLRKWKHRLSAECPWTLIEILAYDPNDPNDYLLDARYLPFVEPIVNDHGQRL